MKKLLSSLFLLSFLAASSQSVVLTRAFNEPVVGDTSRTFLLDTTAYNTGINHSTGTNHLWDYSSLVVLTNSAIATPYVSTMAVSASTSYPGSTMVQKQFGINSFLKSSTTPSVQTELRGIEMQAGTMTVTMNFSNTAVMMRYPFSMGNNFSDALSGTFTFSTTNGPATGTSTAIADGTGTLVLPGGDTLKNVLRVKSTMNILLTYGLFATIKQTRYDFYIASTKFPVLAIGYLSMLVPAIGNTPTITPSYFIHRDYQTVGLKEHENLTSLVSLYPNPSGNLIFITADRAIFTPVETVIYSQIGSVVLRSGNTQIDVSELSRGIYVVEVRGEQGTVRKKLIKE